MRTPAAVAAAVMLGGLPACGGSADKPAPAVSGEQRGILQTIDDLEAASRRGDAHRICGELFTKALAGSIRTAAKRSCAAEVRDRFTSRDERIAVERGIRIRGARATAVIREQNGNRSRLSLVKEGNRWKIERVTPAGPS